MGSLPTAIIAARNFTGFTMTLKKMNRIMETVPAELLRGIMDYNPEKGEFLWKVRPAEHFPDGKPTPSARCAMWNGKYAGKIAFTAQDPRGYFRGAINGQDVYAHRVAVAWMMGKWPDGEIDHINRDKTDNRWANLRVVSHSENRRNTANFDAGQDKRAEKAARILVRARKYPVPGVRKVSRTTWGARIKVAGREIDFGTFKCFGAAVLARRDAEKSQWM